MLTAIALTALGAWSPKQWTHSGENIVVRGLKQSKAPLGAEVQGWFPSQEKGVGAWTNVVMSTEGGDHHGIMFSEKPLTGKQMPGARDRVAVFMHQTDSSMDLERASSPSITLSPIKPSRSLERGRKARGKAVSTPISDLEARLSALEEKHADKAADEAHEPDEEASEEEEPAMLQVVDPVTATFMMPYVAYATVAPFVVPAFAVGTAMAATAAAMGEKSLERGDFDAFPSLEMQVAGEEEPIQFRSLAELEKFLPLAPPPLLFYPWGLAIGSAYFAATVEATTAVATTAAAAFQSMWAPFFPYAAANAAAKPVETAPVSPKTADALKTWYWSSLWYFHMASYYWLFWQLQSYLWMYWGSIGAPQWKENAAKLTEYWKGVYEGYAKTTGAVVKGYTDVANGMAKSYTDAAAGVAKGYADAAKSYTDIAVKTTNATVSAANAFASSAAAAYPMAPFWPFWPKPTKGAAASAEKAQSLVEKANVNLMAKPPAAAAAAAVPVASAKAHAAAAPTASASSASSASQARHGVLQPAAAK